MKVLVTQPAARDPGGVAGYYNAIRPFLARSGLDVEYFELGSTRARPVHPVTDQFAFRARLWAVRPDLVHLNPSLGPRSFLRDGVLAVQAASRARPLLVFFRGWNPGFAAQVERRYMWFFRRTYLRAAAFVVLATRIRDQLLDWGVRVPIHVETTAVDDRLLSGFDLLAVNRERLAQPRPAVLFLSRMLRTKGAYETVEACAWLEAHGHSVDLVMAGDGDETAAIREYARARLGDKVMFPGYVSSAAKAELLKRCRLSVLPSYSEGMPNSILEALAFGLPVVTRPVGGLPDVVQHGRNGLLCESLGSQDIGAAIRSALEDRAAWSRMSREAHVCATERFLASRVADRLAGIYRATIAMKG